MIFWSYRTPLVNKLKTEAIGCLKRFYVLIIKFLFYKLNPKGRIPSSILRSPALTIMLSKKTSLFTKTWTIRGKEASLSHDSQCNKTKAEVCCKGESVQGGITYFNWLVSRRSSEEAKYSQSDLLVIQDGRHVSDSLYLRCHIPSLRQ